MRRIIAIGLVGVGLGGCSSSSLSDYFKSTPPAVQVQLESQPAGADAKTSLGPGCKTPCSVSLPAPDNSFSVTYELAKYEPTTVPVKVIRNPGDLTISATTTTDPNPVFAELQAATPPPKAHAARSKRPKEPKVAAPAAADSAFPDPNAASPPDTSSR